MRTALIALGLVALATPSLALTISSAPNREALPHLKPTSGGSQGVDIRGSWLSSDRPQTGLGYGERAFRHTDAPRYRYDPADTARRRFDERFRPLSPTGADLRRLPPRR